MAMMEQAPQGAQQGGAGQGEAVLKEAGATLLSQASSMKEFAAQMAQLGAPEGAAQKIGQAAQLIEAAMGEMGFAGQSQGIQADGGNPDTAGVRGAEPAQGF